MDAAKMIGDAMTAVARYAENPEYREALARPKTTTRMPTEVKIGEEINMNGSRFVVLNVTEMCVTVRPVEPPVLLLNGAAVYISKVDHGQYSLRPLRNDTYFSKPPLTEEELVEREHKREKRRSRR